MFTKSLYHYTNDECYPREQIKWDYYGLAGAIFPTKYPLSYPEYEDGILFYNGKIELFTLSFRFEYTNIELLTMDLFKKLWEIINKDLH